MALAFLFLFFNDQFLVLEKKKKAEGREFEIYRKQYQCFVFVVFCLPHVHILPSLGSLLQLLIQLLHHRLAPARRADSRDVSSLLASSETRTLARAVLLSSPSPTHSSASIPSYLPLTGSPRPSQEVASHKLASGRCAGEGLCWGAADVWGAENRGRRVAERTLQVSRAHWVHCSAVQLREDLLGQVWIGPGRWQEAENGGRRSYFSGDSGDGVAVVIGAC